MEYSMNKYMNRLVVVCLVTVFGLAFSGCGSSPEDMADEVCECIEENGKRATECRSLAKEHEDSVMNNDDLSDEEKKDFEKRYMKQIKECT